jgi:PAS domain S-box-containing protein
VPKAPRPETNDTGGRPAPGSAPEAGALAAELSRLRLEAAFHQRLRDLTLAFSRGISSSLNLGTALQNLALDVHELLGGRQTSVWIHRRRERQLVLAASSDRGRVASVAPVFTGDQDTAPARGLRLERPALVAEGRAELLLAPLRGWRRALGTLVVEAPFTPDLDRAQLLDLAHELGLQLSATIENIQLLEEVLRQRRLLEDTFNSLIDLVVVTDDALRIVQMNDAFAQRVGLSKAELLDQPLDALVGEQMAQWAARDVREADTDGVDGERSQRFDDRRLGGTFAVTVTPLINQEGGPAGHVLVARDITQQIRLEKEREGLRQRLAQSEKLASLGQFVAGIAHEMNNPLQGVLGHLELMITTSEAAKPLRRDLRRIYQDADRAAKIVKNLLAFTGSHRLARRRMQLGRVLSRVIASRAAALEQAGVAIVRDLPPDLPAVHGDPLLLHQAFLNVLINAEHATLAGGDRRIEVRSRADATGRVVTTTVRDTGPGIPADVLPRMFDPFFTTKEVGKGTGLGLAITYGIIQDHGGTIYAANAPDGGAVLTIELPAAVV